VKCKNFPVLPASGKLAAFAAASSFYQLTHILAALGIITWKKLPLVKNGKTLDRP